MIDKLKQLLGIEKSNSDKDIFLQFALDDSENIILNYCHIKKVPNELNTIWLKMAMDIYRNESLGQEEQGTIVSSISEGDTSTTFKLKEQDKSYFDSILKGYNTQLNRFRKLV